MDDMNTRTTNVDNDDTTEASTPTTTPSSDATNASKKHKLISTAFLRKAVVGISEMDDATYLLHRARYAKALGLPVGDLDKLIKEQKKVIADSGDTGGQSGITFPAIEPWPKPVDGQELLDTLVSEIRRYLILSDGAAEAMALWVIFTHTIEFAEFSPRLALISPTHECGKTTALSILGELARRPLLASNITPAVLFRSIEQYGPTLLIDEADTFADSSSDFVGIVNSGHTRSTAYVMRADGENYEPRRFSTWAAIAIAKIGDLPPTWASRAIVVEMMRKRPDEHTEKLYEANKAGFGSLAQKIVRWVDDNGAALKNARPEAASGRGNRVSDNWHPMLAIADLAGPRWGEIARSSAEKLEACPAKNSEALAMLLLRDMKSLFSQQGTTRISSDDMCEWLKLKKQSPWGDMKISQNKLARLIRPFGVAPKSVRFDDRTFRGYTLDAMGDAFARYLPPETSAPPQTAEDWDIEDLLTDTDRNIVAPQDSAEPQNSADCYTVAVPEGEGGAASALAYDDDVGAILGRSFAEVKSQPVPDADG